MRIGEEIVLCYDDKPNILAVIIRITHDGFIDVMDAKGILYANINPEQSVRTGRYFPEVDMVMKSLINRDGVRIRTDSKKK